MRKTLPAVFVGIFGAAVLAAPCGAAAQECVSCWTEKCPDLRGYAKRCEDPSLRPAATKASTAAPPVGSGCKGGRVEVEGHCCWPGQDYGSGSGQCIGEPQCPESTARRGSSCVPGCEVGKTLVAGHCCAPGQDWAARAQQCVGQPACSSGQEFREGGCRSPRPPRKMGRIAGGSFSMEHPSRQVTVAGFLLDETEVTVGQYVACVRAGGCRRLESNGVGQDHPVAEVSWDEAAAFCAWAGSRLPTEEEWEWAARGGPAGTSYPWGNEAPGRQLCWNGEGNDLGKGNRKGTCPVGSYPSGNSPQGVKDLAGNVWEWTSSTYDTSMRVFRGGSWFNDASPNVAAAFRNWFTPGYRNAFLGFRCARTP